MWGLYIKFMYITTHSRIKPVLDYTLKIEEIEDQNSTNQNEMG